MESRQLFAGGRPFHPEASAGGTSAKDIHGLTGKPEVSIQEILDEIANRIVNHLIEKREIASWAKQERKPDYTAGEVGADEAGSAQSALAEARDYTDAAYRQATGYTNQKIAELVNGAPDTLDTLKEIADAMEENEDVVAALQEAIGNKASEVELQAHLSNGTVHITTGERNGWNATAARCNELAASFQDGCERLVDGCRSLGVTPVSNSPSDIVSAMGDIAARKYQAGVSAAQKGTAKPAQVLAGYTFTNDSESGINGAIVTHRKINQLLTAGQSYTIPEGYHSGEGKVTAAALAGQTGATASAGNLTQGKTAWVNGVKITGTGTDNTAQYNAGYSKGVTDADARANPSSANYMAGYNAGYPKGVTDADARANPSSANYMSGYNAGVAATVPQSITFNLRAGSNLHINVENFKTLMVYDIAVIYRQNAEVINIGTSTGYLYPGQSLDISGYTTIGMQTLENTSATISSSRIVLQ